MEIPEDEKGNLVLPKKCAAKAEAAGAPASGLLHNEKGHWCYTAVTVEIAQNRESNQRVVRGGYHPAPAAPHVVAKRKNREEHNLTIDNVELNGSAAAGLLFVQDDGDDEEQVSPTPTSTRVEQGKAGSLSRCAAPRRIAQPRRHVLMTALLRALAVAAARALRLQRGWRPRLRRRRRWLMKCLVSCVAGS